MTTKSPVSNFLSGVLGGLIVLVVGAVLISTDVIDTGDTRTVVRDSGFTQPADSTGTDGRTPRDIYKREGRGIVFITAEGVTSDGESPFGLPQEGVATGSGFVVDEDGSIVTNAHVVQGADSVSVRFEEDSDFVDAEVKGVDPSTDLAVLKVDPEDVDELVPVPLGNSSRVEVGEPVIAIGNPFGYSRTVTTGIVSGLQRQIEAPDGFTIADVIQTDASINPGNSGGPLLDQNGRVIGINSQIRTGGGEGSVGIGFAVPVNTLKELLPDLKAGETIKRAYLGVQMNDVNAEIAEELELPVERGALVVEATAGGPADEAGLRGSGTDLGESGGDVMVSIDGQPVRDSDDVAAVVASKRPGDRVEVEFYRGDSKRSVTVELAERPESADAPLVEPDPDQDGGGGLFP